MFVSYSIHALIRRNMLFHLNLYFMSVNQSSVTYSLTYMRFGSSCHIISVLHDEIIKTSSIVVEVVTVSLIVKEIRKRQYENQE